MSDACFLLVDQARDNDSTQKINSEDDLDKGDNGPSREDNGQADEGVGDSLAGIFVTSFVAT